MGCIEQSTEEGIGVNTHVTGMDLGGTRVEACLLDQNRNFISRERALSEAFKGRDPIVHRIMTFFRKVSKGKVLPLREWERREHMYLRMAVILGAGVGCGLKLGNKLYGGSKGGAGEIGHP